MTKLYIKSFPFTIRELMKPLSLLIMLAIILPNYFLFMACDYELQQTLNSPDFQIQPEDIVDDIIEEWKPRDPVQNLEMIIHIDPDIEINRKYCQRSQCKFLFVYSNSEKETKTSVHFIDTFAYLANELNRTLVLPNVGQSKNDSCKRFPFEFCYNVEFIRERFPNLSFISQENFQNWTKERVEKPDFNYLHLSSSSPSSAVIENYHNEDELVIRDINHDVRLVENTNCLENFEMKTDKSDNNSTLYQKIIINTELLLNSTYRESISKFLITNLKNSNSEILLIKNEIHGEIFPPKNSSSMIINPYSNQINQETWKIGTSLGPFIAVYWSMIDVTDANILSNCVERLINTLNEIRENFNLNNIYLVTDYPISSEIIDSSSHRRLIRHYRRAIDSLNSTITVNTWHSLDAFSEVRQEVRNLEEFIGTGMVNILDKLISISSDYFITAPSRCSSTSTNNFINDVSNARAKLYYDYDDQNIQNIISRW